jgi:hypothetical protein
MSDESTVIEEGDMDLHVARRRRLVDRRIKAEALFGRAPSPPGSVRRPRERRPGDVVHS